MKYKIDITDKARRIVSGMSNEEKFQELCCAHYNQQNLDEMVPAGSVFFHPGPIDYHKQAIEKFKSLCKYPPLVTTDLEEGPGEMLHGATVFPSMAGCASTGDPEDAYRMGTIAALEGRSAGYNWTLAPCVDINHNPDTPTCTTRTAGRNAGKVISVTSRYIRGCQENGMIATAKHFPGDGFGIYDQHLTTPEMPLSYEEWKKTSGKVYQELIDQGVMSIMPGHISFPDYDDVHPSNGLYPPATLSKKLLTDLLRGQLGFDGLIVSDAVDMSGFCGFINLYEAVATFIEAGGDVVLFANPEKEYIQKVLETMKKGILSQEALDRAATRVLSLKDNLGLLDTDKTTLFNATPESYDHVQHQKIAEKIIKGAMKTVRDRQNILPIKNASSKKVLHITLFSPTYQEEEKEVIYKLTEELKKKFDIVEQIEDPGAKQIRNIAISKKYDYIICSIGNSYKFGTNVIRFHGKVARNLMAGWTKFDTPSIFICHNHHLTHEEYMAVMDTVINTHGTKLNTLPILADYLIQ